MISVQSVMAWRNQWVKPIMHRHALPGAAQTSPMLDAAGHAQAAMLHAGQLLAVGQNIDALVPSLRAALAAVPEQQREQVKLHPGVMEVVTDEVFDAIFQNGIAGIDSSFYQHAVNIARLPDGETMSLEDHVWMHRFWYQVATGQIFAKPPQPNSQPPITGVSNE